MKIFHDDFVLSNAINAFEHTADSALDRCTLGFLKELREYRKADREGLLLRLPCKVGDTIWFVGNDFVNDYEIRRYLVDETGIDCVQVAKEIDGREYWNNFSIDYIGKTVFLTKEEAEQALEAMKGGAE